MGLANPLMDDPIAKRTSILGYSMDLKSKLPPGIAINRTCAPLVIAASYFFRETITVESQLLGNAVYLWVLHH